MNLVDPLRSPERFNRQADALIRASAANPSSPDPFDAIHARLDASFEAVLAGMQPAERQATPQPESQPAPQALPGTLGAASGIPYSATMFGVASGPLLSYAPGLVPPTGIPDAPQAGVAGLAAATPASAAPAGAVGPHLEPLIGEMSAKYEVPAWLVRNVIRQESGGNPNARSPVGAMGLMQLMPGTAAELGVADAFDPRQNVEGGVKYLKKMMDMFGGDLEKAVAAYNAGPGTVQRFGGVPPYDETRHYVRRILG